MLNYTFDWSVLWCQPYGAMMIKGILTTLGLSLVAWCLALILGICIAACRVYPSKTARVLALGYVLIFRNIPFLVQLFFWYFAAPLLLPRTVQAWVYDTVPDYAFLCGAVGLGMYTASRVAEQFRAGLLAIPEDQYRAAYATGLRPGQVYRYVILPYAFRIIIPAFTTEFLTCFKNSALTMTICVMEITHTAYVIDSFTWHGLETTTAASLCYLAIAQAVALGMWRVEKQLAVPGLIRRRG
ncbi:amino acid ABC transporter permease [Desulfobacula toluolica]|uniref:GltJ: glutamate/aspartate transport system permease protein n=1 Tax=Desulfobacula toluolica (strain DSM 7467 / Tol2) TaxID=651182 RepID=K0NEA9_DESTT|nr:amino acid ABC transporter permease [Desulfobacula toluolica]CCK79200.1 GltJ: glutamate/aspartate transport system permease protein [Desulfobacula toluolica Tol2]